MSPRTRNQQSGFQTKSDSNRPVQPQKQARSLKFCIKEEEELYYLCCENKGADLELCSFCTADLRLCFSQVQFVGFLMRRLKCTLSNVFNVLYTLRSYNIESIIFYIHSISQLVQTFHFKCFVF